MHKLCASFLGVPLQSMEKSFATPRQKQQVNFVSTGRSITSRNSSRAYASAAFASSCTGFAPQVPAVLLGTNYVVSVEVVVGAASAAV